MVTLGFVFKFMAILVSLYGAIIGIVIWFVPSFNLPGFTTGIALIFVNVVILVFEVRPPEFLATYLKFLSLSGGRAALLITLGLLYADVTGVGIASWVIFWLLAGGYIVLHFTDHKVIPGAGDSQGFQPVPPPQQQPLQQEQPQPLNGTSDAAPSAYDQV
jgi:hypothetical protein